MFYTFSQNNSGGYFIRNKDVDHYVIIEGDSEKYILDKAKRIFENYLEFCSCCGERWDTHWIDEQDIKNDSTSTPMIYGKCAYKYDDAFSEDDKAIIYYLNGEKEFINIGLNKKEKLKDNREFRLIYYADTNSWGFEYGANVLRLPKDVKIELINRNETATKKEL